MITPVNKSYAPLDAVRHRSNGGHTLGSTHKRLDSGVRVKSAVGASVIVTTRDTHVNDLANKKKAPKKIYNSAAHLREIGVEAGKVMKKRSDGVAPLPNRAVVHDKYRRMAAVQ